MTAAAIRTALEAAAVLLYAVDGMMTAARKRMDVVGTYSLAVVTAFGGGTLRDLLVGQRPFFWVARWHYLVVIAALCVGFCYQPAIRAFASLLYRSGAVVDALGLALFTLTGIDAALQANLPAFVVSLIGVITGTFGGVLRDVCSGEVPELFRPGSLNALSAFAGSWVYLGARALGWHGLVVAGLSFATIMTLRFVSVRWDVRAPDPVWLPRRGNDAGDRDA
ncbi:MAG TPA: TRIC cation channel family protein [Thermoanaerobaculia bacterium]|nr:TRIC cation channel family protein [Thermoanaerobaculia bacterium]